MPLKIRLSTKTNKKCRENRIHHKAESVGALWLFLCFKGFIASLESRLPRFIQRSFKLVSWCFQLNVGLASNR